MSKSKEELETEYLQARSQVIKLNRKIRAEEVLVDHFGKDNGLAKLWQKLNDATAVRDDLLNLLKEYQTV